MTKIKQGKKRESCDIKIFYRDHISGRNKNPEVATRKVQNSINEGF